MPATDLTPVEEKIVRELDERLAELEPQKLEYDQLMATKERVVGTTARVRRIGTTAASAPTRGRRSNRKDEFVSLISDKPGITIPEAASAIGIEANYLYRVRKDLEKAGTIRRDGQKLYIADAPAPAAAAA